MTEGQLPKLLGCLVMSGRHFEPLSTEATQWAIQNTPKAISAMCVAVREEYEQTLWPCRDRLLRRLGIVSTGCTMPKAQGFSAKEKFVVNTGPGAPVKIEAVGGNFSDFYLSGDDNVYDLREIGPYSMSHRLMDGSMSSPIADYISVEGCEPLTLPEFYGILHDHNSINPGALLVAHPSEPNANIFLVRRGDGAVSLVHTAWQKSGWLIGCVSIQSGSRRWRAGSRVFSAISPLV